MKKILFYIFMMCCASSYAQTVIQMEEYGGLFRIPCKVNGAKMKLIFDTGADKVCISLTMAEYLLDNEFISTDDIVGNGSSTVADGSIVDHININIKDIEIQGIHLKNVEAVVIDGQNAPLLLGQSAIRKLGKYSISGNKLIIGANSSSGQTGTISLSKAEIDRLLKEADDAYNSESYYVAIENYEKLYNNNILPLNAKIRYAACCLEINRDNDALDICLSIQEEVNNNPKSDKARLYYTMGICYARLRNEDLALQNIEKAKYYAEPWSHLQIEAVLWISNHYSLDNNIKAILVLENYASQYLSSKGLKATDCWGKSMIDEILGDLYYWLYLNNRFGGGKEEEKYIVLSAAWGNKYAIELCDDNNINYASPKNMYKYSY